MINVNLFLGKVISTDDPDQKGKIQIKLIPEFNGVPDSDCPWVPCFFNQQLNNIAIDDLVWVLANNNSFQPNEMYYIPKYFVDGLINYADVTDILNNITDKGTNNYKDIRFTLYPDGSLIYFNISTGEKAIVQSDGSYMLIDTSGNIYVKPNGKFKLYNTNADLKDIIKDLRTLILNIITPLSWIDGSGKPVTYVNASSDLTTVTTLLTKINNLLKD